MRLFFILFSFLSLAACSYSPDILKDSYNNLGKDYAEEIKQMGDLDDDQAKAIDDFSEHLQAWHRTSQLPGYANLIGNIADKLQTDDILSEDDLLSFITFLNEYPDFHKATDSNLQLAIVAQGISDEQLQQMTKTINDQTDDFANKLLAMSAQQLIREQVRSVSEILKFLDVNLTKRQLDLVEKYVANYHDQRKDLIAATRGWNQALIGLLKQRQQTEFPQRFVELMTTDNLHLQLAQWAPEPTRKNDLLTVEMLQALLGSLSDEQKSALAGNFASIAQTLNELSQQ